MNISNCLKRLWTLPTSREVVFEGGRTIRRTPPKAHTRTRRIEPPPARRSAVAADARAKARPRPYTIRPNLGHDSGAPSENKRCCAEIVVSQSRVRLHPAPGHKVQDPQDRQRARDRGRGDHPEEHGRVCPPPLLAFGYRWVVTQGGVPCNIDVSRVTNEGVFFGLDTLTVAPGADRARLLADGSYHLMNRVDHKPGILPLDEVPAVRVRDVFGVGKPYRRGSQNGGNEQFAI